MKLSVSLLQAIALGVSITAVAASATSCGKETAKKEQDRSTDKTTGEPNTDCPACGMG